MLHAVHANGFSTAVPCNVRQTEMVQAYDAAAFVPVNADQMLLPII